MNLIKGVKEFKEKDYEENKELFESLKDSQKPHTFFIGCSDSRIIPNLITKTMPGELFVLRNIANIIPPYNKNSGDLKCSASILEYAVKFLEVKNIVVCGHSNCGGLKALYYPQEKLQTLPFVKSWLELVDDLKVYKAGEEVEKQNILRQIENLMSYPFVKERVENNELKIHGWYFVIESGDVFEWDGSEFKKIT